MEEPMKCLTCPDTTLAIAERSGVEIDCCPDLPRRVARSRRARQDHRAHRRAAAARRPGPRRPWPVRPAGPRRRP